METAFLGEAYAARSPVLASQTAINIYPELNETKGSDVGGFLGTPGYSQLFTGIGEVRGLWNAEGTVFGVIGNTVYRFDSSWNATSLGTLPNSTGLVSMVDNGTQLAISHDAGWHWVALNGTAIAPVSGAPIGTSILETSDNYGMFTNPGTGEWGLTALGDLSTIDPLQIATAEGAPDNLYAIKVLHREAWLFGGDNTEVWDDTGAAFFPFERSAGGFIEQGCAAKFSVVKIDNSVFWLGRDKNGRGVIYRSNYYQPIRISKHAIEESFNDYSTITDAFAYGYQEDGHSFYVITFPSGDATWVFDISTQMWHQRAWQDPQGILHRHRANCHVSWNGMHIIGDYQNGMIYQSSVNLTTDNGQPTYRERAWEGDTDDHLKKRLDMFELVALMGDGDGANGAPIVWLSISQDAGQTFGYERQRTLGPIGKRKARARWRRAGCGRDTVLKIATTMTGRVTWIAGIVKGEEYSV